MTPEQVKSAIEKLLADNGYSFNVAIIDQRSGLDLTRQIAEQWQYAPVVSVIKKPDANQ